LFNEAFSMPKCTYPGPGGCPEFAVKGNVRCSKHLIRNQGDAKKESVEVRKLQMAKAEADRRADEQRERNRVAKVKADADQRRRELQAEVISAHRQTWNAQIDAVVGQVMALRVANPGANAGNNWNGTTLGGNTNAIVLTTTGAMHGVTRADILHGMAGFDSSDSGMFKFRRSNVLVHCT